MKAICLRTCFVGGRLWVKDEVGDVPDKYVNGVNFDPMGQAADPVAKPVAEESDDEPEVYVSEKEPTPKPKKVKKGK